MRLLFWNKKAVKDLVDENEITIRWADELIFDANHLGEVSRASLDPSVYFAKEPLPPKVLEIRNHVIDSLNNPNKEQGIIVNALINYLGNIKNHLLSHRYIENPDVTKSFWKLSKRGWLVKELDGHFKYKRYRRRKLNVLRNQFWMNFGLILATALAASMPFVAERCNRPTSIQYLQPPALYPTVNVSIDTVLLKKILKEKEPIKSIPKQEVSK